MYSHEPFKDKSQHQLTDVNHLLKPILLYIVPALINERYMGGQQTCTAAMD